ncbi:MAG: FAD-binding oxidoreductase [Firmicutes bacterium]|nr:FAD-binding oxidoreductase [Bacillota bacterium]
MKVDGALALEFQKQLGAGKVLTKETEMACYAFDSSFLGQLTEYRPDAVVKPDSAGEVAAVMRLASRHRIPVTPRGAGTAQTGGAVPVRGGIVLDLSSLNRIIEVDTDNLQVLVEPGIVHADLNAHLARFGFFFPPDPGSSRMCTLGGMVSNNSSGMRAVKYGTTRQYVLGLEVVLPGGEIIWTGVKGSKALKTVSGYDLTQLMVGSEGTLGIITKIRLKILPMPEKRGLVLAAFDTLEKSGEAVISVFRNRLFPSAIEILDKTAIRAAMLYKPDIVLPQAEAALLFEVDGSPADVVYQAEKIAGVCGPLAGHVEWTDDPVKFGKLWQARQVVGAAAARVKPGVTRVYDGEDICVPITKVPQALRRIQEIGARHGLTIVTYGHIGDGNLHSAVMANLRDPAEVEHARQATDDIHRLALELGGTTTGEHGVGLTRAKYMEEEHGLALEVMRGIKKAFDPDNILNPGKMALETVAMGETASDKTAQDKTAVERE